MENSNELYSLEDKSEQDTSSEILGSLLQKFDDLFAFLGEIPGEPDREDFDSTDSYNQALLNWLKSSDYSKINISTGTTIQFQKVYALLSIAEGEKARDLRVEYMEWIRSVATKAETGTPAGPAAQVLSDMYFRAEDNSAEIGQIGPYNFHSIAWCYKACLLGATEWEDFFGKYKCAQDYDTFMSTPGVMIEINKRLELPETHTLSELYEARPEANASDSMRKKSVKSSGNNEGKKSIDNTKIKAQESNVAVIMQCPNCGARLNKKSGSRFVMCEECYHTIRLDTSEPHTADNYIAPMPGLKNTIPDNEKIVAPKAGLKDPSEIPEKKTATHNSTDNASPKNHDLEKKIWNLSEDELGEEEFLKMEARLRQSARKQLRGQSKRKRSLLMTIYLLIICFLLVFLAFVIVLKRYAESFQKDLPSLLTYEQTVPVKVEEKDIYEPMTAPQFENVSFVGLWRKNDNNTVSVYSQEGQIVSLYITSVRGNAAQIATADIPYVTLENNSGSFQYNDSFGNSGYGTIDFLSSQQLRIRFEPIPNQQSWGVNNAEGDYTNTGLAPEKHNIDGETLGSSSAQSTKNVWEYQFYDIICYPISEYNITTYAQIGVPFEGKSYIDGSATADVDACVIRQIYNNGWIKVSYQTYNGVKTAYCYLADFVDLNIPGVIETSTYQDEIVYKKPNLAEKLGTVSSRDISYVVSDMGYVKQIIYHLDSGGWKMGWISSDKLR